MPPTSPSSSGTTWKFAEVAFKILSVVVIPVLFWGVKLEVNNAIQDERIAEIQDDLGKLADITKAVQENALAMVRLEGKIDNVNQKIDEVRKLLR